MAGEAEVSAAATLHRNALSEWLIGKLACFTGPNGMKAATSSSSVTSSDSPPALTRETFRGYALENRALQTQTIALEQRTNKQNALVTTRHW